MVKKAAVPNKKTGKEKAEAPAQTTSKKRVIKGESLVCGVCGLSVIVEEVGGIAVMEESALLCCGKPMKKRASKSKAIKK